MKKIFMCAVVFLSACLFYVNPVLAAFDYEINNYAVNVKVNEDNTFDVVEKIGVYFNVEKHGIYRNIPLENKIVRLDGTKSNNRAEVTNISSDEQFSVSTISSSGISYKEIKIGDPNKTIKGQKDYMIKYTYDIGKDTGNGYDEFYFNIIGSEWVDTQISGIAFTIEMPKKFDTAKVGFSAGNVGSTGSSNVKYSVNGNTVNGTYGGTIYTGQALTIRIELPDGYFVERGQTSKLSAAPTSSKVFVNGKSISFDAYNINGNNYFKLRDLAYVLSGTQKQFEVSWNGANNSIALISDKAYTKVAVKW